MTSDLVFELSSNTLRTTAMIAAPLLLGSLAIGLMVSVFQAITQINEATLTFIPKIVVIALILVIAGPWMVDVMVNFTTVLFSNIGDYVRN
ncbi:MAG: flagellar biosynthesis protein FliQ [Bdellovibrionales bacterium]